MTENTSQNLDPQLDALHRLDLITSESGWFVYCIEEQEWHLYNDEEELLFRALTLQELANKFEPYFDRESNGKPTTLLKKFGQVGYTPIETPINQYTPAEETARRASVHGKEDVSK